MNTAAIVEFGTSKVICAVSQQQKDGTLQVKGAGKAEYSGFMQGKWLGGQIDAAITKALAGAQSYYGHKIKKVFVGLPGFAGEVVVKTAELVFEEPRPVSDKDLSDLIRQAEEFELPEGKTVLHRCVLSYTLDGKETMEPRQSYASRVGASYSFVLADTIVIHTLTEAVKRCGPQVVRCLFAPLGQGIGLIPNKQRDSLSLMIDMGYFETTISLFKGDGIIAYQRLDTGGAMITSELALKLDIPFEHAEQLKKRYVFGLAADGKESYDIVKVKDGRAVSYPHSAVRRVIEEYTDWFIDSIREFLNAAGWELFSRNRIYFTGGGLAMNGGIREHLTLRLDRQIRIIRLLGTFLTAQTETSALGSLNFIFAALQPEKKSRFRFGWKHTEV
ncbi:MAG: cell division FtsA domain-containing protein [Christensenellales bacterium]